MHNMLTVGLLVELTETKRLFLAPWNKTKTVKHVCFKQNVKSLRMNPVEFHEETDVDLRKHVSVLQIANDYTVCLCFVWSG